jgi:CheY-like chemotaxis protein
MPYRLKALTFDLDAASLTSLQEALPEWKVEPVNGATAGSLTHNWNPGAADLLVVKAGEDVAETLALCRFLVFCNVFSTDSREDEARTSERPGSRQNQIRQANAPLLLLVRAYEEALVRAALEAGVDSCLLLPIHAKEVTSMIARVQHCNQPGRHTLNLDPAQIEDRWRDDGGQG